MTPSATSAGSPSRSRISGDRRARVLALPVVRGSHRRGARAASAPRPRPPLSSCAEHRALRRRSRHRAGDADGSRGRRRARRPGWSAPRDAPCTPSATARAPANSPGSPTSSRVLDRRWCRGAAETPEPGRTWSHAHRDEPGRPLARAHPDAAERCFAAGALDVWVSPGTDEEGTARASSSRRSPVPADERAVSEAILRETTTLGVRVSPAKRWELERANWIEG